MNGEKKGFDDVAKNPTSLGIGFQGWTIG